MDSIDKRMHFFDRQFLRARDFQAEQAYHIDGTAAQHRFAQPWRCGGIAD